MVKIHKINKIRLKLDWKLIWSTLNDVKWNFGIILSCSFWKTSWSWWSCSFLKFFNKNNKFQQIFVIFYVFLYNTHFHQQIYYTDAKVKVGTQIWVSLHARAPPLHQTSLKSNFATSMGRTTLKPFRHTSNLSIGTHNTQKNFATHTYVVAGNSDFQKLHFCKIYRVFTAEMESPKLLKMLKNA